MSPGPACALSAVRHGGTAPPAVARRLFFALWPDAPQRERLARAVRAAVRASGGRPIPSPHVHLTLAFLGNVSEARLAQLAQVAGAVAAQAHTGPIGLSLDRLEYWARPRILCALPARPPAALDAMAGRLLGALTAAGFAPDLKPFRPHVTVARKVTRPSESSAMPAVRWRLDGFALIESRTLESGPVYSVVDTYPLCAEARATK